MTTFLDRIPVDRITRQARDVHAGRALLTLIAGAFYVVGWVVFKVAAVLWLALAWCAVATREGWRQARGPQQAGVPRG